MNKRFKELFSPRHLAWYGWDFGTQILLVNTPVYFSEWLVVDNHVPDFWYSLAFIVSTIVLIFLSPWLGAVIDRRGNRKKVFFWLTLFTLLAGGLIEAAAGFHPFWARVASALVLYALLNLFFQLASVVFNTFLKDISTKHNAGLVAGLGSGFSTIGDTFGLLLSLPIVLGLVTVFGTSRVSMLWPATILAAAFCLPMYFAFRGLRDEGADPAEVPSSYREIWRDLRDSRRYPGVGRLLLAYGFYNDAILTLQLFAAIYLEKVYRIPDSRKAVIIMIVYLSFAIGAWAGGYVGDRVGNKRGLMAGVVSTGLVIIGIALSGVGPAVYVLFCLFGLSTGVAYANTKALFSKLIPYNKKAQFFGVYAIFERFASVVGPLVWGAVVYLAPHSGALNYRLAALAMSFFLFLGALIARKVREDYADTSVSGELMTSTL